MSEINYEIISQYLEGKLSGEVLIAFEKEMNSNPELAEEVALYRTIHQELTLHVQHEKEEHLLANNLKELNGQYFRKEKGKVKGINRWWYAAAAIAAAVVLIIIVRPFSSQPVNNEKLFAYYSKDVEDLPAAERGNDDDTILIKAANFYNKKEYKNALPFLQAALTRKPDDTQVLLAIGFCYL